MPTQEELLEKARKPAADAMRLYPLHHGRVQTAPKCPVHGLDDFATWYTPGVAASYRPIHESKALAHEYTNKGSKAANVSEETMLYDKLANDRVRCWGRV
jgi:malate dehydrogenase (oxaloacetate-decarboxylating)